VLNERLMEEILSRENLRSAYRAVIRNNGAPGVDGQTVEAVGPHLKVHWPGIEAKLYAGEYQPALVKGVRIPKPNGGERLLGIPTVQDRIIQQAVQQRLSLIFEPQFSEHSYGFRPGRSAHDAVRAAQAYVREGKSWVVDIDISAFFDHVNHDILMERLARRVRDKRVLKLIGRYLRAGMRVDGQVVKRQSGTPQGGPLSPLLANIYLDALDKELESRELSFCRYADDVNIYVSSERSAERVLESISAWINKHLKLKVNPDKSGSGRPGNRKFLGFSIQEDGSLHIAESSLERYKDQVRTRWRACQSLTGKALVLTWQRYIRGWINYFGIAETRLTGLSGWTRRHMRKYFWLRWHNRKGRLRHLTRLGVSRRLCGRVDFSAGAWRAARHPAMHTALGNGTLRQHGLWTPSDFTVA